MTARSHGRKREKERRSLASRQARLHRARRIRKENSCVDCGTNTGAKRTYEYYMVRDDVWALTGFAADAGQLCIGCLEEHIGRRLTPADFLDCRLTTDPHPFTTDRLLDRLGRERQVGCPR